MMIGALLLLCCTQNPEPAPAPKQPADAWELLTQEHDANGDGKITRKEYSRGDERWNRLDKNGDGVLLRDEVMGRSNERGGGRRGGRGSLGGRRDGRGGLGRGTPPKVGKVAPDFDLEILPPPTPKSHGNGKAREPEAKPKEPKEGKKTKAKAAKPKTIKLSSFKNKRPVALIFGSYT